MLALLLLLATAAAATAASPLAVYEAQVSGLAGEAAVERTRSAADVSDHACWGEAADTLLEDGCDRFTVADRVRVAALLTNCHLRRSGLEPVPCDPRAAADECARAMGRHPGGGAFSAYTSFYTHADTVCRFVRADSSRMRAADSVARVHAAVAALNGFAGEWREEADRVAHDTLDRVRDAGDAVERLAAASREEAARQSRHAARLEEAHGRLARGQAQLYDASQAAASRAALAAAAAEEAAARQRQHEEAQAAWRRSATAVGEKLVGGQRDLGAAQEAALRAQRELLELQTRASASLAALETRHAALAAATEEAARRVAELGSEQREQFQRARQAASAAEGRLAALVGRCLDGIDRVLELDLEILSQLASMGAALFYAAAVPVALLLTTLERTRGARAALFFLLWAGWLSENLLSASGGGAPLVVRRFALPASAAAVLLVAALRYRDPAAQVVENGRMLEQLVGGRKRKASRARAAKAA